MKRFLTNFLYAAAAVTAAASCGNSANKGKTEGEAASSPVETPAAASESVEVAAEPVFDIVTNLGTIRIKLFSDTPLHRDNFVKLAKSGFYKGILFHRVIDGFMIQAGDPLTKNPANKSSFGTGGPGYTIPAEILPEHRHKKGALAAARRGDMANPMRESSGSQFYLVQDPVSCAQLDGQYTVFGETLSGFDVIDKIAKVPRDGRDCPLSDVKILKVTEVVE
ncbi:MAG: peptidylprolyl isomerase [Bacteroidales bacterium]|nr:peptidylprolyl isomerase [Bacteroidales bacterium]